MANGKATTESSSEWIFSALRREFIIDGCGHPACWSGTYDRHGCDGGCSRPDFPGRSPEPGDIALCGAGHVGVILHSEPQLVTYADGNQATAWIGVHVGFGTVGKPWSSRNPCIIGRVGEMEEDETIVQFVRRRVPMGWLNAEGKRRWGLTR